MINIRDEGEPIKMGINIYPLSSNSSFGIVLKTKKRIRYIRYSKNLRKWFFSSFPIIATKLKG